MQQIMMAVAVDKRHPDIPDGTPAEETIRKCFNFDPTERPTAAELGAAFTPEAAPLPEVLSGLTQNFANQIAQLTRSNDELKERLRSEVQEKDAKLQEKDVKLQEKDAKLRENYAKLQEKDAKLQEKDAKLQEKDAKLQEKDTEVKNLKQQLLKLKKEKDSLQSQREPNAVCLHFHHVHFSLLLELIAVDFFWYFHQSNSRSSWLFVCFCVVYCRMPLV
jgi:predicted RNase H-like nuclease (RuvC/YqgF family)